MSETANQQTETLVGATLRDNDFTLKMTGMSDMTFEIKAHSIKEGQPWGGISQIICVDGECTITVQAGRKGSSDVADWFKSQVGSGSAVGCGTIDMWPSEMNFAFIGTMTYKHGWQNLYWPGHCDWSGAQWAQQLVGWWTKHVWDFSSYRCWSTGTDFYPRRIARCQNNIHYHNR